MQALPSTMRYTLLIFTALLLVMNSCRDCGRNKVIGRLEVEQSSMDFIDLEVNKAVTFEDNSGNKREFVLSKTSETDQKVPYHLLCIEGKISQFEFYEYESSTIEYLSGEDKIEISLRISPTTSYPIDEYYFFVDLLSISGQISGKELPYLEILSSYRGNKLKFDTISPDDVTYNAERWLFEPKQVVLPDNTFMNVYESWPTVASGHGTQDQRPVILFKAGVGIVAIIENGNSWVLKD